MNQTFEEKVKEEIKKLTVPSVFYMPDYNFKNIIKAIAKLHNEEVDKYKKALRQIVDNHFECDGEEACQAHNTAKEALTARLKQETP